MALTATFTADFDRFNRAIDAAAGHLQKFDASTKAGMRSLTRELESFSGQKIANEAAAMARAIEMIGGTSKLTTEEMKRANAVMAEGVAKMKALGLAAPPEWQKIATATDQAGGAMGRFKSVLGAIGPLIPIASFAAAGTALMRLGKAALESASHITDLSNKTGLTIDTIQRMQHVAAQTGTSVDVFTQATFKMGATIAEGGRKAQDAIEALGLSFDVISRMSPDQQFAAIIKGLEGIDNQQERNRIGIAIFGRQFSEIAAAVGEGYTRMAEGAAVATDAQIQSLDRAADAWQAFKDRGSKSIQAFMGDALIAMNEIQAGADKLATTEKMWLFLTRGAAGYADALREVGREQQNLARTNPLLSMVPVVRDLTMSEEEMSRVERELTQNVSRRGVASERASVQTRKMADAAKQAQKELDKFNQDVISFGRDAAGYFGMQLMLSSGALGKLETKLSDTEQAFDKTHVAMRAMGRDASGSFGMEIMLASGALGKLETQLEGISQQKGVFGDFLGKMGSSLKDIWKGMSGGGGIAGLFSNIGGGIISGGLNKLMDVGLSAAWSGLKNLFGAISKEVMQARQELERFQDTLRDTLSDDIRRTTQGWEQDIIAVRDAMLNLGRTEAEALRLVEAMWDTDNPRRSKEAIEEINRVLRDSAKRTQEVADAQRELTRLQEDAKYTFQEMQQDVQTLGIDFERMGGLFAQAKIDDTSKRYVNAISNLAGASGDIGMVLFESRDALSKLAQEAKRAGTTLPENMKEWLEELVRAQLLVDENGEALQDLSGIRFGDRIATEAEIIKAAMESLEKVINRIADVLENFPSFPSMPDMRLPGQTIDYGGPQARGGDYLVTKPTLFMAGEAGAERATFTPVGRQGRALAAPLQIALDGRVVAEAVIEHVGSRLALRGAR